MDSNKTQMLGSSPTLDPNKTMMGTPPTLEATMTIKPVQCPVCKTFNPVGVMFCVDCGLIFDRALPDDAFGAPAVRLPCLLDSAGREHQLRPGDNVLGRQGDVVVEDTRVSRRHAQVTLGAGGEATLQDLGSTNGTKLDGQPLMAATRLTSGQVISLGGYELTFSMPGESEKTVMPMSGKTAALQQSPSIDTSVAILSIDGVDHPLQRGENSFGRKSENDIAIPDPYVSGRHGVIEVTDDEIYLTDIGSTNGTMLNDAKLTAQQKARITPDDVIRLGQIELRVRRR